MGTVSMNINMNSISELHKSRTTFQINQNQQMDSYSKSLQEQINNANEQLQSLGDDKEMSKYFPSMLWLWSAAVGLGLMTSGSMAFAVKLSLSCLPW